jgi:diguanylate cyclase (GGDEF)-like protein
MTGVALSRFGSYAAHWRARLARRADTEHVQALIRIGFGLVFFAYLLLTIGPTREVVTYFVLFEAVACAMLAAIAVHPQASTARRALAALVDMGTTTIIMIASGEVGAPFYGVYLWVTFGNGFRYGVRALYLSQAMSVAGFAAVVALNPFWREHGLLSGGLLVLLAAVPTYGAILLRKLELANRSLREQAMRDPLTGLYNRRYLVDAFERELHRARRSTEGLGVMLIDIDRFKRVNDTYGHAAGDEVLRATARFMLGVVRAGDILCRLGGEEFVLLQTRASAAALLERAEQLKQDMAQLDFVYNGRRVGPVTLSIGVAMFPWHGDTVDTLLYAADAALYEAKNAGRDRVVMAAHPEIERSLNEATAKSDGAG